MMELGNWKLSSVPNDTEWLEPEDQCPEESGGFRPIIPVPPSDWGMTSAAAWVAFLICFCACTAGLSRAQAIEGADALTMAHNYPEVRAAIAACPQSGCIVYANSPSINKNLGVIDPGNKTVTLYLGPYTYTVKQIVLRKGMKIIGMGGADSGTILQSVNGNDPVFVVPQVSGSPSTNVKLEGFRLYGSKGNTSEDGFFIDSSNLDNGGLWYSTFTDVYADYFAGSAFHFRGPSSGHSGTNQFLTFVNVAVWRKAHGGPALKIEGAEYQFFFENCMFEGQAQGDGTNIFIGGGPGPGTAGYPYIVNFRGVTSERADTAVQIDGGTNIEFDMGHHELLNGAYLVTYGANGARIPTDGLVIANSSFNGNVGAASGNGFILKVTTSQARGVVFRDNMIYGSPDHFIQGTNLAQVVSQDNDFPELKSNLPLSSGATPNIQAAAIINIGGVHTAGLVPSGTPITTMQGMHGPGEYVTLFPSSGTVVFSTGGNLELGGLSALKLEAPASVTFVRTDLPGGWKLVSTSSDGADAGQIVVSSAASATQKFTNSYNAAPLCVVTPTSNPESVRYWVSSTKSALTVNLSTVGTITFNYVCRR
jgi:hypothetical protein